jgi:4-hydroxyphenylacetate 3-monooxygenase
MVRTGAQYVESLKDGRQVYINGSKVDDVTTHPAFRNVVKTVAELYDIASDSAIRGLRTPVL